MRLSRKAFLGMGFGACAAVTGIALAQTQALEGAGQGEGAEVAAETDPAADTDPAAEMDPAASQAAVDIQKYIGWWVTRGVEHAAELPAAGAEELEIARYDEASGEVEVNIVRVGPSAVVMRNTRPIMGAIAGNRVVLGEFDANTGERCCGSLELHGSNLVTHVYALERTGANEVGGRASIAFESAMAHDRFHDLRQLSEVDGRRLFGHIDDKELDETEAAHLSPKILVLGLTEPAAARGVTFAADDLDAYYGNRTWYRPRDDASAEEGQTDIERANLALLQARHDRWVECSNGCGDSLAEPAVPGAPQFMGTCGEYGFAFDDSLAGALLTIAFDEAGQPVLDAVHNMSGEVLVDHVTGKVTSYASAEFEVDGAILTLEWIDPATVRPSSATVELTDAVMDVLSRQRYINRGYLE